MTGLTDACVEDLCAAIRASKTLKSVELRNNSLTDVSVPALIQVMQQSQSMHEMKYVWFTSHNYTLVLSQCKQVIVTFNFASSVSPSASSITTSLKMCLTCCTSVTK